MRLLVRWIPLIILLSFAVLGVVYYEGVRSRAQVGEPVPDFTLPDLEDRPVRLSDYRGQVIFINFWTTWCDACREETNGLQAFEERYGDRVVQFGINVRESKALIRDFEQAFGTSYLVLRDRTGAVSRQYRLKAVPESWFIDAQGVARVYRLGAMRFEEMQAAWEEAAGRPIDGQGVGPVRPGDHVHDLLVRPAEAGETLWLATHSGLYRSTDGALSWVPEAVEPGTDVLALAVGERGAVLALTADGRVIQVADSGEWTVASIGGPVGNLGSLEPSLDGSELWVWGPEAGVKRSSNGGRTWAAVELGGEPVGRIARLYPQAPFGPRGSETQRAWMAATARGLVLSADRGRTWRRFPLRAISPDPQDKMPWDAEFRRPVLAVATAPWAGRRVWLASDIGIWLSEDGGDSFRYLRESPARYFAALRALPERPEMLWGAAPNGDIYQTKDGGMTWSRLGAP